MLRAGVRRRICRFGRAAVVRPLGGRGGDGGSFCRLPALPCAKTAFGGGFPGPRGCRSAPWGASAPAKPQLRGCKNGSGYPTRARWHLGIPPKSAPKRRFGTLGRPQSTKQPPPPGPLIGDRHRRESQQRMQPMRHHRSDHWMKEYLPAVPQGPVRPPALQGLPFLHAACAAAVLGGGHSRHRSAITASKPQSSSVLRPVAICSESQRSFS